MPQSASPPTHRLGQSSRVILPGHYGDHGHVGEAECVRAITYTYHPLLAIFSIECTAFCTYSMGSRDTVKHRQRARACRCGGKKIQGTQAGSRFPTICANGSVGRSGFWDGPAFRTRVICRDVQNTTFYKGLTMPSRAWSNITFYRLFEHFAGFRPTILRA